jgi:glycosyltransferase involved in cell wall biosynthesis
MRYALVGGKQSQTPVVLCGALHPTDSWSFDRTMIYKTILEADAYVAHSKFEQDYVIQQGLPIERAYAIGVGLDLATFTKASGVALRQRYDWDNAQVIGFVGHLANRKGVPHLLQTMPKVWAHFPKAKLLLAGASTHYLNRIEQMIAQLTLEYQQNVVIKADFPEDCKAEIFAACDMLVLPSTEESFGIVFLEAWACGKPVIGLRAGAIPTIIANGADGVLAKPGDTDDLARVICELLANPQRQAKMGQAGYQKVKNNYTWDIVTAKFRQVYEQVRS